jgi:hypothetical protein
MASSLLTPASSQVVRLLLALISIRRLHQSTIHGMDSANNHH